MSTGTYFLVMFFLLLGATAEANEVGEVVQLRIRSRTEVAHVRSSVCETVFRRFLRQPLAKCFSEADDLSRRCDCAVQDATARFRTRNVWRLYWHFFLGCLRYARGVGWWSFPFVFLAITVITKMATRKTTVRNTKTGVSPGTTLVIPYRTNKRMTIPERYSFTLSLLTKV